MDFYTPREGGNAPPSSSAPKMNEMRTESRPEHGQTVPVQTFRVRKPEPWAALAWYALGYVYVRLVLFENVDFLPAGWGLLAFAAVFCGAVECFCRCMGRPAGRESGLWLAVTLGLALAAGRVLTGGGRYSDGLAFLCCVLGCHGAAGYWVLCRTGLLTEGRTGPLLPIDLCHAFFTLPFGQFALRERTLWAAWRQSREGRRPRLAPGSLRRLAPLAVTLCVMVPLWVWIIKLLCGADAGFEALMSGLRQTVAGWFFWDFDRGALMRELFLWALGLPVGAYLYGLVGGSLRRTAPLSDAKAVREGAEQLRIGPTGAVAAALAGTCGLYVLFFAVQAGYLFGALAGRLPEGFTAAEYARRGFFDLCTVCGLNFALLTAAAKAARTPLRQSRLLRGLAAALCAATGLLGVTAAAKLWMYIARFGLTEKRILSAWAIGMMLLAAGLALATLLRPMGAVRPLVLIAAVSFTLLALLDPPALAVRVNTARETAQTLRLQQEWQAGARLTVARALEEEGWFARHTTGEITDLLGEPDTVEVYATATARRWSLGAEDGAEHCLMILETGRENSEGEIEPFRLFDGIWLTADAEEFLMEEFAPGGEVWS